MMQAAAVVGLEVVMPTVLATRNPSIRQAYCPVDDGVAAAAVADDGNLIGTTNNRLSMCFYWPSKWCWWLWLWQY